jgi:hypothetical protein
LFNNILIELFWYSPIGLRTFLSDAYTCDAEWKGRLNNPLLEKLKNGKVHFLVTLWLLKAIFNFPISENFYGELLKKFQKESKASPIDVDLVSKTFTIGFIVQIMNNIFYSVLHICLE